MAIFKKIGQNGEPEFSLEAFFWVPDLWDFPVYFTIFCEMYPNFGQPQKLNRWEVVEHILDAGYPGLQHISEKKPWEYISSFFYLTVFIPSLLLISQIKITLQNISTIGMSQNGLKSG